MSMFRVRMVLFACALLIGVQSSAAEQVLVTLSNGDQLHGTLVQETSGKLVIEHPILGKVEMPRMGTALQIVGGAAKKSEAERPEGSKTKPQKNNEVNPASANSTDTAEIKAAPNPWKGSVSLAASASDNTKTTYNVRLGGELKRTLPLEKFSLTASWYWNQSDGRTTDNDVLVRADQEWDIERSKWFYFAQGTWQYDQFESWGHRLSPYGGIGYNIFDTDDLTLALKGGGGATVLYNNREVDPQLLFEISTSWKINKRQTLTGFVSMAPDVTDWSNYLLTIQADWKLKLDDDSSWSLALGLRNIHYSQPTGGASADDFKAYAGIDYGF
ncbi:MAG: DUF481 domain-containing protein [Phycisphaerales bacterium]|nr:DUF481 domain-containing protein [Phycisphaerales bacterium]